MKKIIIGIVIGVVFSVGVVFAADVLITSMNVSYVSTYTEKTNVSDAIDELFELSDDLGEASGVNMNGTEPILKGNLIPVIIRRNGSAVKADTSKRWYDYGNQVWANAVELNSGETDTYTVGSTIPKEKIRSYFVWIPKYKYRLWNINSDGESTGAIYAGPHSIDIEFGTTNTTDEEGISCATPMTSNGTGNCNNGEWMTHPAFISMGVDGFWVGKFEIGNKLNTTTAAKTAMTSSTVSNIVVKPDYYSWTSTAAIDYFNLLKTYNTTLDSHMIKNTEWGAVAYLSHSKYGKNSEININNNTYDKTNWYSKTGYSSRPEIDQHTYLGTNSGKYGKESTYHTPWNTKNGYRASTTGNISGIYDMSGGSQEYVAGFRTGVSITGDSKYYDLYNTQSNDGKDYKYRILGDATGEMGPFLNYADGDTNTRNHNWYGSNSNYIGTWGVWFQRGAHADEAVLADIFNFQTYTGVALGRLGSRLVLSPTA